MYKNSYLSLIIAAFLSISITACGGSSDNGESPEPPTPVQPDNSQGNSGQTGTGNNDQTGNGTAGQTDTTPTQDLVYSDPKQVARFLNQATFGAKQDAISSLTGQSLSEWYQQQLTQTPSYLMPVLNEMSDKAINPDETQLLELEATTIGFWRNAINSDDQLRQRVAFALSQILVVSNGGGEVLTDIPSGVTYYQDLLIKHAFGNYRDILEAVTYSPAMGQYLTYRGSKKGDPETGRMPDENYARELLQLFTLGVIELNSDGSPKLDSNGQQTETYSNHDITGLARVFTGFNLNSTLVEESLDSAFAAPMNIYPHSHSEREKSFLGTTIAANTAGAESVTQALDHIFAHPNLAPFVTSQLIQRLVTSNPQPAYVARVSIAFNNGEYTLPNGDTVGTKKRGDLAATIAAILFDEHARTAQGDTDGKIREPLLRLTHWARAFNVAQVTPEFQEILWDTTGSSSLSQHPYRSPSVFNFYRPGYIAPGTKTGEQGLKAPEMQIINASSVAGYTNLLTYFVFLDDEQFDTIDIKQFFTDENINIDTSQAKDSFIADYSTELALASDVEALVTHLDLLLTNGALSTQTRSHIIDVLNDVEADAKLYRVRLAIVLIMTSPDYLIQQ